MAVLEDVQSVTGIYSPAESYYSALNETHYQSRRTRTYSPNGLARRLETMGLSAPIRRGSHDAYSDSSSRQFLVDVDATLKALTEQEDTDGNVKITIEDTGPKVMALGTALSSGHNRIDVRGTYMLSNLLQELTLAKDYGRKLIVLDEARLNENPVNRLARLIRDQFWDCLTRRIDASTVLQCTLDPKDWSKDPRPRIYIPPGAPEQYAYYKKLAADKPELRFEVHLLPDEVTPEFIRDLNDRPGALALAMEEVDNPEAPGTRTLRGVPFVVPGGRFNELYGWDSYMMALGALVDDRVDLAQAVLTNFCFCIRHYGKVLNATRTYLFNRTQPPFVTDLALRVYEKTRHEPGAHEFLREAILAAVKEYHSVWTSAPRFDAATGLSKYRPMGKGVPPECERSHFMHILTPYMEKYNMSFDEFVRAYNYDQVHEPVLDEYFLHDRALRESGHDSSYRLEGVAADLATVDLNSLLFKYELDIARTIRDVFGDRLVIPAEYCGGTPYQPGETLSSAAWDRRAKRRKRTMDALMWNDGEGMFFDYNTKKRERTTFESCTTLYALWAGVATPRQAALMVQRALPKFEALGGIVSGTEKSRGGISPSRPERQWDYPYGWAPHQMLAWTGLLRYGFTEEAERLVYKWLYMMTKAFVDFNGVVVEKYDLTRPVDPHRVDAEYGNQGLDFQGVAREGFGWANASYVYGLRIIDAHMRRALGTLTPYDTFSKAMEQIKEKDLARFGRDA